MQILVTDDNSAARKILSSHLQPYGEVDEVQSGMETVDAVRSRLEENNPYQLIFLDINMPQMTGLEALSAIRSLEKDSAGQQARRARIVMISSMRDKKTVQDALTFQADGFLLKPTTPQLIKKELKRLKLL